MELQEAHDLCSLAMLRPVIYTGITQPAPFVVEVCVNADGQWRPLGRGEGETRDDAFLAAMTDYAIQTYVRAAQSSQPVHDDT